MAAIDLNAAIVAGQALLGYALVAITPGPNLLLISATAALRGFLGALPHCLGISSAIGGIAVVAHLATDAAPDTRIWADAMRGVSALLLVLAAVRLARPPSAAPPCFARAGYFEGLRIAAANPIPLAYFFAMFGGPLQTAAPIAAWVVVIGAPVVALANGILVASLFSHPAIRRRMLTYEKALRWASVSLLLAAAVQTAWPIFQTGLLVPPPVNPPPSAWMPIGGG